MTERIEVTVNGTVYSVEIDNPDHLDGVPVEVRVNGQPYTVQVGRPTQSPAPAVRPVEPSRPAAEPRPVPAPERPTAPMAAGDGQGRRVTAPMPGKILSVAVQVGDTVRAKDTLCTLEAMKMEMTVAAPAAGSVREVRAQVGANVVYGDLLFVLE